VVQSPFGLKALCPVIWVGSLSCLVDGAVSQGGGRRTCADPALHRGPGRLGGHRQGPGVLHLRLPAHAGYRGAPRTHLRLVRQRVGIPQPPHRHDSVGRGRDRTTDSAELGTAREAAGVRSIAFYGDGKVPVPAASYSPLSAGGRSSPCRDRLPSCPTRCRPGQSLLASRNRRGACSAHASRAPAKCQ
jgi:hypothetical protein